MAARQTAAQKAAAEAEAPSVEEAPAKVQPVPPPPTVVHPSVHQLLGIIVGELPAVGKNQRNASQGFNFRGIDDVLNVLNPILSKYGVFFVPDVVERVYTQRATSKGGVMHAVDLHVRYTFYGPGRDSVTGSVWGEGTDSGDKATNKAMTMAMKNILFQVFAISTDEVDPDAGHPEETVTTPRWMELGWPSEEVFTKSHRDLQGNLKQAIEKGELSPDDQAALKALGFGWPMKYVDFGNYTSKADTLRDANVASNAAEGSQDNDLGGDPDE